MVQHKKPLILLLLFFVFMNLTLNLPLCYASDDGIWDSYPALIAGLSEVYSTIKMRVALNFEGSGWKLIYGKSNGQFNGCYWNGTQWIYNSSLVTGLGDLGDFSSPSIAFNITGNNKWDLIATGYNTGTSWTSWYGFNWNGTRWVSNSSLISGLLGGIDMFYNPDIIYNLKSDNKWCMIYGDGNGYFHGCYWNGSSWVNDPTLISGVTSDFGYGVYPSIRYNFNGNNKFTMISGYKAVNNIRYMLYHTWNDTSWVRDTSFETISYSDKSLLPCMIYNLFEDNKTDLLVGHDISPKFSGYTWVEPPTLLECFDTSTVYPMPGDEITHCANWSGSLSHYIFSWDNGVGVFENDTAIAFGSNTWSNITKTISSSALGLTIQWLIYANSTDGLWASTPINSYTIKSYVTKPFVLAVILILVFGALIIGGVFLFLRKR